MILCNFRQIEKVSVWESAQSVKSNDLMKKDCWIVQRDEICLAIEASLKVDSFIIRLYMSRIQIFDFVSLTSYLNVNIFLTDFDCTIFV